VSGRSTPDSPATEPPQPPASSPPAASPRNADNAYVFTGAVSRKDRKLSRQIETVDGLEVRLNGTDAESRANLEVRLDGRRIAQLDKWRPGWRARVKGLSGGSYELLILDIHHPSQTVRFGLRRAGWIKTRAAKSATGG